jgi:hypothetical protein
LAHGCGQGGACKVGLPAWGARRRGHVLARTCIRQERRASSGGRGARAPAHAFFSAALSGAGRSVEHVQQLVELRKICACWRRAACNAIDFAAGGGAAGRRDGGAAMVSFSAADPPRTVSLHTTVLGRPKVRQ